MARRDYIDDPGAPAVNSVVPSVVAAIVNDDGEILLIHRTDNHLWAMPGGGHEPGESISDTVVREVREETGIECQVVSLFGVYTNPGHVMAYDDGEVRQQFSIGFRAIMTGGQLRNSSESRDVRWVHPSKLASLPMHPSMRMRIEHALGPRAAPFIG